MTGMGLGSGGSPPGDGLTCSFCGKSKDEVRALVAGPGVTICDECTRLANEIVTGDSDATRSAEKAPPGVREALRALPQVDAVLRDVAALGPLGPALAKRIVVEEIEAARARVLAGEPAGDVAAAAAARATALLGSRVRRVINATGVVLHTNTGRAPLSAEAVEAVRDAAGSAALEIDLGSGERGRRAPLAPALAAAMCGAEDALVVNNNAGALLLALAALAAGREVVVSRGELIEIGGSFRLPAVMEASGAVLREAGTTNKVHLSDYRDAIGERTALVLTVHPSNYRVVGFTGAPALGDVAALAHERGLPLLFDTGSGLIEPAAGEAFAGEPDAATALADGADIVCFSGDKLLGGPQAGILAGRRDLVEACRRHPIARAVRADKLSLAALEATLLQHARGEAAAVPAVRMMSLTAGEIEPRARALAAGVPGATAEPGESLTGGGSVPGVTLPTVVVAVERPRPERLAAALRRGDPPVVARVERGRLLIDLRTVDPSDDGAVAAALREGLGG